MSEEYTNIALDIAGEFQTLALQFGAQAKRGARDEELARLLHDAVLSMQRMERGLNARIRKKAVRR